MTDEAVESGLANRSQRSVVDHRAGSAGNEGGPACRVAGICRVEAAALVIRHRTDRKGRTALRMVATDACADAGNHDLTDLGRPRHRLSVGKRRAGAAMDCSDKAAFRAAEI